jgi:hypothetical protein
MATDLFSRQVSFGGVFSADAAAISFSADGVDAFDTGMLVQNVQWQYQQNVTRLYEISGAGTAGKVYVVAGRTQGQASVQRVLGPAGLTEDFYDNFGDVCNIASNNITFSARADCSDPNDGTYGQQLDVDMNYCVLVRVAGAVSAQDMVVNESLGLLFLWLTYEVTAASS